MTHVTVLGEGLLLADISSTVSVSSLDENEQNMAKWILFFLWIRMWNGQSGTILSRTER